MRKEIEARFWVCLAALLLSSSMWAQTVSVKGEIRGEEDAPLEGATCVLLSTDSVLVTGCTADSHGKFAIKNIAAGDYILQVSFIGFSRQNIALNNLDKNQDLGTICLLPDNVLNEVTVVGTARHYGVDKQVFIPTQSQLTISNNAWALMQNLQLSRIKINPLSNEIQTQEGDAVILQINGQEVPRAEVVALRPQDIVRVEYVETPGARYQAGAVINYVVKHPQAGGYTAVNAFQTLSSMGIKRYDVNSTYNWKKSQVGIIVGFDETRAKWIRENEYLYSLPEYSFTRTEEGQPTLYKDRNLNASLKYSLMETGKYQFSATLRNKYNHIPNQFSDRKGYVTSSYADERTFLEDHSTWKENVTSLDLYFQRNLKDKQLLILDVVGTLIDSDNSHSYREEQDGESVSDIYSLVEGKKYSLIAEGVYEGSYKDSHWSTGIHHTQSYTDNDYSGDRVSEVGIRHLETYLFADYRYSHNKFTLSAGLSGKYVRYSQKGEKYAKFHAEPRLRMQYLFANNLSLKYNARLSTVAPSQASLNDTEQEVDRWQSTKGNPLLKTYMRSRQELQFGYNSKHWGIDLTGRYYYDDNPIMTSLFYEGGKIVSMEENQRNKHRLIGEATLKLHPFGEYLSLNLTPGVNRFIVHGNAYTHTYTNWYMEASLVASYKRWFLNATMNTPYRTMDGETITYGEAFHQVALGYNAKNWNVTAGAMLPFTKEYSQASRNVSKMASGYSRIYSKDLSRLFFISASINLNYGKKFKTASQKRSNSDEDSGILSGSKRGMQK